MSPRSTHPGCRMHCVSMLGGFLRLSLSMTVLRTWWVPGGLSAQLPGHILSHLTAQRAFCCRHCFPLYKEADLGDWNNLLGSHSYQEVETGVQSPILARKGICTCCSWTLHACVHVSGHCHCLRKSSLKWEIRAIFESPLPDILRLLV